MKQLACILIALAVVGVYADEPEKLVGGIRTDITSFPHCVSLRINNQHNCGGSLISSWHVVTAAHCIPGFQQNIRAATIVTGTSTLNSGGNVYRISRLISHPQYSPNTMANDIALVKSATQIPFNARQQPIRLPTRPLANNEEVTVAAWGSQGLGQNLHNDLRMISGKCMLADICQRYHQGFMNVYPTEFCTLIGYGTGTCHGDSGSGVMRNSDRTLVGVVSRGRPCARNSPDVYTRLSSYTTWINSQMT